MKKGDKKLILLIDDEKDIRDSVGMILTSKGYDIITAKNGKDGLTKLSKKPDLIVLDVLMPGLTTKEILEKIKEQKVKTPIILLTAVTMSEASRKEVMQNNIKDYIMKPFVNSDFLKRVQKALK